MLSFRLHGTAFHIALLASACGDPSGPVTSSQAPTQPPGYVPDAGKTSPDMNGGNVGSAPPSGASDSSCVVKTVQTMPSIPDMLIVLDRSGSMSLEGGRWSGSVAAISDVVRRYDEEIRFGLMTFPGVDQSVRCAPGTVNVPVGPNSGDVIANTLAAIEAEGSTPTAASLEAARQTLGPATAPGPDLKVRPKFVLLVTDGGPNCSATGNTGTGIDKQAELDTLAAIAALAGDGIPTYVVGFQTAGTVFSDILDAMAIAGNTGSTAHRSVNSGDDLAIALEQVVGQVTSCDFALDTPVDNASYVAVSVDGRLREFNSMVDGWILSSDRTTVTLTGEACTDARNGATLQIEVRCKLVSLR